MHKSELFTSIYKVQQYIYQTNKWKATMIINIYTKR